ncbi:MAG: MFS transporter [Deltaproteobacteria bacterium]|nr:MFS transporter [Deltaproteobacteria bacterium]
MGSDNEHLISKRYSYSVFILLFLLYLFDYIDRMVVVSLFPYLKSDWGLSDTQCGMLVSAVYWSIVIFSFPVSVLIDRWSRKKIIGLMAIVWSIATVACAFTRNLTQLFFARTVIGVGEAGYAPGGTAMISAFFPEKKRAMLLGLFSTAVPIGSALGIALGGFIATRYGWRHAFGIVAIPGLLVAVLFFFVKDYKTVDLIKTVKEEVDSRKKKMKSMDVIREFTHTPSLILTYLAFAGNMFVVVALLSWLPTYFNRFGGLPMEKASVKAGMVMLLSIVGAPLGGFIADRWRRRSVNARLYNSALFSALTALIFFLSFTFLEGTTQYIVILIGGISAMAFAPSAIAVTQDVVHPGLRAVSYSFCVIFQNLLGSSLGPIFVGAMSDHYNIETALIILPSFTLLASFLYIAASRFYVRDLEKVEKITLTLAD